MPLEGNNIDESLLPADASPRIKSGRPPKDGGAGDGGTSGDPKYNLTAEAV